MSGKKNFVIDTNVIIHDPNVLNGLCDNNILIPLPVLEEIDSLKKGRSDRARAAREFIRQLEKIRVEHDGDLHTGIQTETFSVRVLDKVPPSVILHSALDSEKVDNIILHMVEDYSFNVEPCILITKDVAMRVKADALGIVSQDYFNSHANIKDHYDKFQRHDVSGDDVGASWNEDAGRIFWTAPQLLDKTSENEFFYISYDGEDAQLVRRTGDKFMMVHSSEVFGIGPRNNEQAALIDVLMDDSINCVAAVGKAGTGKTLVALACGLEQVLERGKYDKIVIARPTVAMDDDIGYLPGGIDEKLDPWLGPIHDSLGFLFKSDHMRGQNSLNELKYQDFVEVQPLSYIRGRSIANRFIIIDESQNLSPLQVKTIVTRVGQGSKIVMTGDPYQIDNPYLDASSNGLTHLVDKLTGEPIFASVVLHDTERSELAELAADKL